MTHYNEIFLQQEMKDFVCKISRNDEAIAKHEQLITKKGFLFTYYLKYWKRFRLYTFASAQDWCSAR